MAKSDLTPALVLKRSNFGETDRIVTLFSEKFGKISVVAKGSRKLHSSRRGHLEPGNFIDAYIIHTKSLPILTQTRLINELPQIKATLQGMKKLFQILEIVDILSVEEEQLDNYQFIHQLLHQLDSQPSLYTHVKQKLEEFIASQGFQHPNETKYATISEYIAQVADRPLRSYQYLTVKK